MRLAVLLQLLVSAIISKARIAATLVLAVAASPVCAPAQASHATGVPAIATRYVTALQKRDYKTVIDLSAAYQVQVDDIKAKNPQVLWPKVVGQYYDEKTKALTQQSSFWQDYGSALGAMVGDPARDIRSALNLLPPSAKWSISETRQKRVQNMLDLREYTLGTAYVTVSYPNWQEAPLAGNRLLKETILDVSINMETQRVQGVSQVAQSDTYRNDPLRIAGATLGENYAGMTLSYLVVGGTAPITCNVKFGSLQANQDCSDLKGNFGSSSFDWKTIRGSFPMPAAITVSDSKGQSDTVSLSLPAFPPVQLNIYPLWRYCWVRGPWFQRGLGDSEKFRACQKPIKELGVEGGVGPGAAPAVESAPAVAAAQLEQAQPPETAASAGCGDYNACMKSGAESFKNQSWQQAIQNFQGASTQRPDSGEPWAWLGNSYAAEANFKAAADAWDRALTLGNPIALNACRERGMKRCDAGVLFLSAKNVVFTTGSDKQFDAPSANVSSLGAPKSMVKSPNSLSLQVAGTTYDFDFFPFGMSCQAGSFLHCPQDGVRQQVAIRDYINRTIPKLSGMASPPASPQSPAASPQSGMSADDIAAWRRRIETAWTDAIKLPPFPSDWQRLVVLKLSNSLDNFEQLYLAGVNRRSLAVDSLVVADRNLKQGNLAAVKKAYDKALRLSIDGDQLFKAATNVASQGISTTAQIVDAVYVFSRDAASQIGVVACGPACADLVDYAFMITDYAVDSSMSGQDVATKNLLVNAVSKFIVGKVGFGDSVGHLAGQPNSVYSVVSQVVQDPTARAEIMKIIGREARGQADAALSAKIDPILHAILDVNRDCGQVNLSAPSASGSKPAASHTAILGTVASLSDNRAGIAPYLLYSNGKYQTLPDGTPSSSLTNIAKSDLLPSGQPNPASPKVRAALQQSPLAGVKEINVYGRGGKLLGTFTVTGLSAEYDGAILKVVALGHPNGFDPQAANTAVVGNAPHDGFWPSATLTTAQRAAIRTRALAMLPKTVPSNHLKPQLVGKPIVVAKPTDACNLFDLNHDGNTEAFCLVSAALSAGGVELPDGVVSLFIADPQKPGGGAIVMSAVLSAEGEELFGNGMYTLVDVLDVDGDGHAEIILSSGAGGEVGNLEIYRYTNGHLVLLAKIPGWWGS